MTHERTNEPGAGATGAGNAISVFSGASIGLMIGVLLGQSLSPVVGIFLGALGTALAALLGLNDAHFSTAKGLRIGSLGLAVLVGGTGGIYMRTHNLLSPSLEQQRDQLRALGYPEKDALRLLEGRIVDAVKEQGRAGYFGAHVEIPTCDTTFVSEANRKNTSLETITTNFSQFPEWNKLVSALPQNASEDDKKSLLFMAMNAACGEHYPAGTTPARPTKEECGRNDFARIAALNSISTPGAIELLGPFLCALPNEG